MAMCANNSAGSQSTSNHSLYISSSIDRKEPEETNDSSQSNRLLLFWWKQSRCHGNSQCGREKKMKKTDSGRIRMMKKAAACALAIVFLLSACGMAKSQNSASESAYSPDETGSSYNSYKEESYDYDVEAEESMDFAEDDAMPAAAAGGSDAGGDTKADEGGEQADLASENRKIVYSGNISLQTLEYDSSSQSIHDKINKYGGFIESENTSNDDPYWYYRERSGSSARRTRRNLSITARIPAEKFDAFMEDLKNDGQVINTSVNAENISVSYANHDASRKALEIEQERLLKMMDKAESIEEMIAVEERLTEVERELGNERTKLSAMDRDVNFSTIYINLEEVFEYSETVVETTYGERLKRAFDNAIDGFVVFWEDLILFIVGSFPFLIMLVIIIVVIVKLARRAQRRRKERLAAWEESRRAAANGSVGGNGYPSAPGAVTPWDKPKRNGRGKGLFGRGKNTDHGTAVQPAAPARPADQFDQFADQSAASSAPAASDQPADRPAANPSRTPADREKPES